MSLLLKTVKIKNFRAFGENDDPIELAIPDGETPGSGLTILVGENGSGKTTVLEGLEFLVKNTFAARSRVSVGDFPNMDKTMLIEALTTEDFAVKRLWGTAQTTFNASGFRFHANVRGRDESARLLDPITLDNEFIPSVNLGATSIQDVEKRLGATGPYGVDRVPLRIHYFDKNRTRHLVSGKYQTKMDDILGDLNFQFLKWLKSQTPEDKSQLATQITTTFDDIHSSVSDKVVSKAFEQIKALVGDYRLKLDFASLYEPYSSAAVFSREDNTMEQIPVNKLGSGIEMMCSLVFLETIYKTTSEAAMYCIDEPEMHLHPQLQTKLFDYLLGISKDKQVVITTHSTDFVSVATLPSTIKLRSSSGEVEQTRLTLRTVSRVRPNRNFFERHKTLLFARKAIFVEGADDLERYALFAEANGYSDLSEHIVMMNGKDSARLYEKVCSELGIKFAAIVDKDYSYEQSLYDRSKAQRFLERIKQDWPDFDLDAFKVQYCGNGETPRGGNNAPETVVVNGTQITKVASGDIFVLSEGEVTDYLSKEGVALDDAKHAELIAVFSKLRELLA